VRRAVAGLGLAVGLAACATPQSRPSAPAEPHASDAGAVAEAKSPDTALSAKDVKVFARTLAKVSEMRGFPATRPVPGVKLPREALVARVRDKALREYPPEALRREGLLLQLTGLAPASFDYLGELLKLLEAQLEGFYEPKNGTMYLAADLRGGEAEATLAHELVHALQDQRWDLRKRSDYRPGRGDESMALACLAEGDATSLMLDFLVQPDRSALDVSDQALRDLMRAGMNMGDKTASVPHVLQSTLVAPYIEGVALVHAMRRRGGWAAVDRVWDRPPTTTEQVLHPEKWDANEPALPVVAPTARALGEGWKKDDEDTYGELGFALTFAEWMSEEDAREAAAGWGGDRAAVYVKGDELAYAVHARYDAAGDRRGGGANGGDAYAARAFGKLVPALTRKLGTPARLDAASVCFERAALGPLLFARVGRELVMIAGAAKVARDAWSSAGTCATARAWADEIAAQP
jgi:hypothetical protein